MRLFVLLFSLFFVSNFAFANEGAAAGEDKPSVGPSYLEITPKFVVNLLEPRKYLAINVQLLIDGTETDVAIKKHMPVIKHELIMLFSDRSLDSVQTMEQREALRQAAIETIHNTIDKAEGVDPDAEPAHAPAPSAHKKDTKKDYSHLPSGGFKDAFFTEFLVQ
jgi:flagellar FliL protein